MAGKMGVKGATNATVLVLHGEWALIGSTASIKLTISERGQQEAVPNTHV